MLGFGEPKVVRFRKLKLRLKLDTPRLAEKSDVGILDDREVPVAESRSTQDIATNVPQLADAAGIGGRIKRCRRQLEHEGINPNNSRSVRIGVRTDNRVGVKRNKGGVAVRERLGPEVGPLGLALQRAGIRMARGADR
jgi:hypothetical protein